MSIHDSFARLIKERPASRYVAGINHNKNFVNQPSVILFTPLLRIRVYIVSIRLISDRFSNLSMLEIQRRRIRFFFTIAFIKFNFIAGQ